MEGINGGKLNDTKFPNRYLIDYIRVYQKKAVLPVDEPEDEATMD